MLNSHQYMRKGQIYVRYATQITYFAAVHEGNWQMVAWHIAGSRAANHGSSVADVYDADDNHLLPKLTIYARTSSRLAKENPL